MSNPSKRKGSGFEREVVNTLNEAGIPAKRVPLSGAMAQWKGDVVLEVNGRWIQAECKRRKAGFKTLYGWLGMGNSMLFIRDDHCRPMVVMPVEDLVWIINRGDK